METQRIISRCSMCLRGLLGLSLLVSSAGAQVFDLGPSDASLFDTVINVPSDPDIGVGVTLGDGFGSETIQLNISDGGVAGQGLTANLGSEVNISGGLVGNDFQANSGSEINISGGNVGNSFEAFSGSAVNISGGSIGELGGFAGGVVNISGGSIGPNFDAESGSTVNLSGGLIGGFFDAFSGSVVNVSGGTLGPSFDAFSGSVVNISGGSIGDSFDAFSGSEVNLFGSDFVLDGESLDDGLTSGEAFTIVDREVTISGRLDDGSAFSFDLNSSSVVGGDTFASSATLTVTLVSAVILGDVNQDGTVTFFDISPFIMVLADNTFLAEADCDQDGDVDFFDISPFIEILAGS